MAAVVVTLAGVGALMALAHERGPGEIRRLVLVGAHAHPLSLRICLCAADRRVELAGVGGRALRGHLYLPGGDTPDVPAPVLLLHGNTPHGSDLAVYHVLGRRLAEAGFRVLGMSFGGYGGSEDPFVRGTREGFDFEADIRAGIRYLVGSDTSGVFLLGHSMGAAPALRVAIRDPRVIAFAGIGPPRRTLERARNPSDLAYFWSRAIDTHRQVYGRSFPEWFTRRLWLRHRLEGEILRSLPALSDPGHVPVLLLDGEREHAADRQFLAEYHSRVACPRAYVTVAGSDHYLNAVGWKVVLYDADVVKPAVAAIVDWFRGGWRDCGAGGI